MRMRRIVLTAARAHTAREPHGDTFADVARLARPSRCNGHAITPEVEQSRRAGSAHLGLLRHAGSNFRLIDPDALKARSTTPIRKSWISETTTHSKPTGRALMIGSFPAFFR